MAEGIRIDELPESFAADENSFLAVADGEVTRKISVATFNETANGTAQAYAQAAATQATNAGVSATAAAASASDAALKVREVQSIADQVTSAESDAESAAQAAATGAQTATEKLSEIQALYVQAQALVTQIQDSATLSQSYAVGGTGTRTGEDNDNAQYYAREAQSAAGGGVLSFNGRGGAVTPRLGDYTADTVGYETVSGVTKTTKEKIQEIDTVMTGATAAAAGVKGLVPAPSAGDQNKALLGSGRWGDVSVSDMTGATSAAAGTHGLVPAPAAGDQDKYLKGDGTFGAINVMTGATSAAAGTSGLVPAPAIADSANFLKGDGNWGDVGALIDDAIDEVVGAALIKIETTDWSAETTTVSGVDYYTATKAISAVHQQVPDICIGVGGDAKLPTDAEQSAFNSVSYVTYEEDQANGMYLALYATSVPENDFYIIAEGVSV